MARSAHREFDKPIFANIYLNLLDHFIKEHLRIKAYLRYMDDFIIFFDDKADLLAAFQAIEAFVYKPLKLKLRENACCLNQSLHGLSFLGYRIFPSLLRHQPANYQRSQKKIRQREKAYAKGLITEQQLADSVQCIFAHRHYFQH